MEELEASVHPFARFVWAHLRTLETQGEYETRKEWKLRLMKGLYSLEVSEEERSSLLHDFDWLLALPMPEADSCYRELVRFEEEKKMPHLSTPERVGRREGRKEGALENLRANTVTLLTFRFGELPPEAQRLIQQADRMTLDRWFQRGLDAVSLDEVLSAD